MLSDIPRYTDSNYPIGIFKIYSLLIPIRDTQKRNSDSGRPDCDLKSIPIRAVTILVRFLNFMIVEESRTYFIVAYFLFLFQLVGHWYTEMRIQDIFLIILSTIKMVNSDAECEEYMELLTDVFINSPGNFHLFKKKSFASGAVMAVIVW